MEAARSESLRIIDIRRSVNQKGVPNLGGVLGLRPAVHGFRPPRDRRKQVPRLVLPVLLHFRRPISQRLRMRSNRADAGGFPSGTSVPRGSVRMLRPLSGQGGRGCM